MDYPLELQENFLNTAIPIPIIKIHKPKYMKSHAGQDKMFVTSAVAQEPMSFTISLNILSKVNK